MARRTNAWDMMPPSSQESRLDDFEFEFDLSRIIHIYFVDIDPPRLLKGAIYLDYYN